MEGRRTRFPDALTIASDGVIWFTDGSQRFPEHHDAYEFLEGRATGRLLSYDPATREVRVRLDGNLVANLQDRTGRVATVTHVVEGDGWLYSGSLRMPSVARTPTPLPH